LVCDENIDDEVFQFLKSEGFDVVWSKDLVGVGAKDSAILKAAFINSQLVLTHDRDFGALAFASKNPFFAIMYLRPGHLTAAFTIESIRTLLLRDPEFTPPFVVVCERVRDEITLRIRQPITW
jgi:predicted nuclease of predicted toxin-antitoxin system